jgi:NAD-dependent dihydropyrimidine dehydrogenase PreA subunit
MRATQTIILINEKKCTGCKICQLICSFTHKNQFNPDKSFIKVEKREGNLNPKIYFTEKCIQCFKCVSHCSYNALKLEEA